MWPEKDNNIADILPTPDNHNLNTVIHKIKGSETKKSYVHSYDFCPTIPCHYNQTNTLLPFKINSVQFDDFIFR